MDTNELSLDLLRAGNRAEFARLVTQYSPQIYRLALKMLGSAEDAEDVLQETFIQAFKALPNFEGRSSLSTWLYRIATNQSLMRLRKHQPIQVSVDEEIETDDGDSMPRELFDWCCLPEVDFLSAETQAVLNAAVKTLPDTLRSTFLLRDIEGLSVQETADVLGINPGAVKTRLLRARLKLREHLSVYFTERARQQGLAPAGEPQAELVEE